MKRREFNKSLAAATAVSLSPFSLLRNARAATASSGATQVFNFSDFTGNLSNLFYTQGNAGVAGSALQLITTGPGHHGAQLWYRTQVSPGPFTTTFQFQTFGLAGSIQPAGFCFVMQNIAHSPPAQPGYTGLNAGGDANMTGYGASALAFDQYPPQDALAIKFSADNAFGQCYPLGGYPSHTGMYLNSATTCYPGRGLALCPDLDLNPSGINFYNQHVMNCTIVYDGSFVTMTLLDTETNAQARFVWPLNIALTTNSQGLTIGFSSGCSGAFYLKINNWAYYSGYNTRLTTPTLSLAPGQYSGAQTVSINYPSGSTCYYTINGLPPTSSSTKYSGPITVSANAYVQAVAIQAGFTDSNLATASYQIDTANLINMPSGIASGSVILCGTAYMSGSTFRLSDTTQGTGSAVWFPAPVPVTAFSTSFTVNYGGSGQGIAFVLQNTPPAVNGLTNVQITGSGGQISFSSTTVKVGDYVTISGTNTGSGSISGFSNQDIYSVGATNGSTTATLTTAVGWDSSSNPGSLIAGKTVTTSPGTPAGLTFSHNVASFTGGPTVCGAAKNAIGYGGMDAMNGMPFASAPGLLSSVAVVINQTQSPGSGLSDPNCGVGLYQNGAVPYGSQVATGLNFMSGSWKVTVTYDGSTLTFTMQSANGGSTFTHSWPVNIPSTVGGNTAYAGFTGGSYGAAQIAAIQAWTYASSASAQAPVPVPAAPTNLQVK